MEVSNLDHLGSFLSLTISECANPTSGLKSYLDGDDSYEFLYPNSGIAVDAKNLVPDVIFRDLIERSENMSGSPNCCPLSTNRIRERDAPTTQTLSTIHCLLIRASHF